MKLPLSLCGAGLACALLFAVSPARAAPVVLAGSSYTVSLTQASTPGGFSQHSLNFDGVAETCVHRTDGPVSLTVQESQTDLGSGRYAIDIALAFSGGDPFPDSLLSAAVGIGSIGGADGLNGLDLARPVALTAFSATGLTGSGDLLFVDYFPDVGWLATTPWNGLSAGGFLIAGPWARLGLQTLTLHFETRDLLVVSSPGTVPLLALGLLALALRRPRPRPPGA
ncbi:MAG: hypothetical protein Q8M96_19475, partial [Rubrivivax sp.]|nr:hypothetical protein [Rubrivivax sp.]